MSAPERPTCQACGTQYQSTWRWCLACGDDPDGLAPAPHAPLDTDEKPAARPTTRPAEPAPAERVPADKPHARRKTEKVLAEAKADGPWSLALIAIVGVLLAGGVYLYRVRSASSAGTPAVVDVASTLPVQWATYQPPDASFSVDLPGQPFVNTTEATLGGAPANRTEYLTLAGNANVGVSMTEPTAPGAAPVTAAVLDAFVKDIASRTNAQVTGTTPIEFGGAPGLDYVIDINGVGQNRGRIISVGPRVYNIYLVAAQPDLVDLERVTASFVPA